MISKTDLIIAVAGMMPAAEYAIHAQSVYGFNFGISNDMSPESVHLRNGGEPWKGSSKRKMRVAK